MSAEDERDLDRRGDPLHRVAPPVDDVDTRRARAAVAGRLFSSPSTPVTVGRYRIHSRIGAGAMGVVYRAHDPELARDVAVKLMNAEVVSDDRGGLAQARLVREARAMARLAHPNVITVHDVGTVQDGVFIAMELVEGQSLAAWLTGERRSWREILRVYLEAGLGLAAAHAAGLVHRDFKPENVLLGADGRARVGDFGLAGVAPELEQTNATFVTATATGMTESIAATPVEQTLTRTGALLGTPKYMAPEQEAAGTATPRSDQFSFCVALFEALYGYAPFAGETLARYRFNVRAGNVLPAPTLCAMPSWLHGVLARGLSVEASERYPSMDALLERLQAALQDPRASVRRRRRALQLSAALAGTIAVSVAFGWSIAQSRPPEALALAAPDEFSAPSDDGERIPDLPPARASNQHEPGSPTLARTIAEPEPEPREMTRPAKAEARGRKRSYCYFHQDKLNFLRADKLRSQSIVDAAGQCWDCRTAPSAREAALTYPESAACTHFMFCAEDSSARCKR